MWKRKKDNDNTDNDDDHHDNELHLIGYVACQQYPDSSLLIATRNFEFVLRILTHAVSVLLGPILCTPGAGEGDDVDDDKVNDDVNDYDNDDVDDDSVNDDVYIIMLMMMMMIMILLMVMMMILSMMTTSGLLQHSLVQTTGVGEYVGVPVDVDDVEEVSQWFVVDPKYSCRQNKARSKMRMRWLYWSTPSWILMPLSSSPIIMKPIKLRKKKSSPSSLEAAFSRS